MCPDECPVYPMYMVMNLKVYMSDMRQKEEEGKLFPHVMYGLRFLIVKYARNTLHALQRRM